MESSKSETQGSEPDTDAPQLILLRDGHFADFTIQSNCEFLVSRAYLYCQSGYFKKLLLGETKEVYESRVKLDDVPACLMARFISMCYQPDVYPVTINTADYAQSDIPSTWQDDYIEAAQDNLVAAKLAIKLYELGDRLDARRVKQQARLAFLQAWAYVDTKSGNGSTHIVSKFRHAAQKSPEVYADLIKQVYSNTHPNDRGLRDIVFRTIKMLMLCFDHYRPGFSFLGEILEDNPDLALDVALHTISAAQYPCESCKKVQRLVIYPCRCEQRATSCAEKACVAARRERSFCFACHKLATIDAFPPARLENPRDIWRDTEPLGPATGS